MAYVYRDGSRLTPWMLYCVDRFSQAMYNAFGERILVTSGIRTYEDQKRIFLKRYVRRADVRGRKVYDTRWWNGALWYRIDPVGTVRQPGLSNHEVQGSRAAVDLRDTGRDAGISKWGSARANWARANAHKYGLVPSGYGFSEAWHFDIPDIFRTPPAAPAGGSSSKPATPKPNPNPVTPEEEEDDMPKNSGVWYKKDKNTYMYLVFNTGSGFAHEFYRGVDKGTMPGDYTAGLLKSMDISAWSEVTELHAKVIKSALTAIRPKDAPKEIDVTLVDPSDGAASK